MNKNEFIRILKEQLAGLPEEEVKTAVRYYEEYFDDAGVENEAKIVAELGSPELVAKKILEGGVAKKNKNTASRSVVGWSICGVVLCIMILSLIIGRNFQRAGEIQASKENGTQVTHAQKEYIDVDKTVSAFKSIDVDVDTMDVTVEQGETYSIKLHYWAENEVSYKVDGDVLVCTEKSKYDRKNNKSSLTIYVPKETPLDSAHIKVDMGDGNIKGLEIAKVHIESGMGDAKATEVKFDDLEIELGMGDSKLQGTIQGNITIRNGMGDNKLQLVGKKSDYNYNIQRGMGDIKIDGKTYNTFGNIEEEYDGTYDIVVEDGMGDTTITFE